MTDTPLTDAHVRQLADGLAHPHWVAFARGLERENADLRAKLARLDGLTNWVCSCGGTDCKGQEENAALRADKERLDWLSTALGGYWACEHFEHRNRISRTYIDAGMADNPTPAELKGR